MPPPTIRRPTMKGRRSEPFEAPLAELLLHYIHRLPVWSKKGTRDWFHVALGEVLLEWINYMHESGPRKRQCSTKLRWELWTKTIRMRTTPELRTSFFQRNFGGPLLPSNPIYDLLMTSPHVLEAAQMENIDVNDRNIWLPWLMAADAARGPNSNMHNQGNNGDNNPPTPNPPLDTRPPEWFPDDHPFGINGAVTLRERGGAALPPEQPEQPEQPQNPPFVPLPYVPRPDGRADSEPPVTPARKPSETARTVRDDSYIFQTPGNSTLKREAQPDDDDDSNSCLKCGSKMHTTRQCRSRPCFWCHDPTPDHAPSDCPLFPRCENCGKRGHKTADCKEACTLCGETGHTIDTCGEGLICDDCGRQGHIAQDCRRYLKVCVVCNVGDHVRKDCPDFKCDKCGEQGHKQEDCPEFSRCGQLGHNESECEHVQPWTPSKSCDRCGSDTHDEAQCPQPPPTLKYCTRCKQFDHQESDCKLPPKWCPRCENNTHDEAECRSMRPYCKRCGSDHHNEPECPAPPPESCNRCGELGHKESECKEPSPISCDHCGSTTHTESDCPIEFCTRCERLGHDLSECPEPPPLPIQKYCNRCQLATHNTSECQQPYCNRCKSNLHNEPECPQPPLLPGLCQHCRSSEHQSEHCPWAPPRPFSCFPYTLVRTEKWEPSTSNRTPSPSKSPPPKPPSPGFCIHCHQPGHRSPDCPYRCKHCSTIQHRTEDCPRFCNICSSNRHKSAKHPWSRAATESPREAHEDESMLPEFLQDAGHGYDYDSNSEHSSDLVDALSIHSHATASARSSRTPTPEPEAFISLFPVIRPELLEQFPDMDMFGLPPNPEDDGVLPGYILQMNTAWPNVGENPNDQLKQLREWRKQLSEERDVRWGEGFYGTPPENRASILPSLNLDKARWAAITDRLKEKITRISNGESPISPHRLPRPPRRRRKPPRHRDRVRFEGRPVPRNRSASPSPRRCSLSGEPDGMDHMDEDNAADDRMHGYREREYLINRPSAHLFFAFEQEWDERYEALQRRIARNQGRPGYSEQEQDRLIEQLRWRRQDNFDRRERFWATYDQASPIERAGLTIGVPGVMIPRLTVRSVAGWWRRQVAGGQANPPPTPPGNR